MWFPNAEVAINPALLLLLGVMVGTLSGFFGVGGGFLITGGLLVFGVPPVFAVGTGLALIMGSSIINTLKHRHLGNVDLRLGLIMLIGTLPYIALQIRAVTESMRILTQEATPQMLAFGFCLTLILFAILFGARHVSPREKHQGLVVAIIL